MIIEKTSTDAKKLAQGVLLSPLGGKEQHLERALSEIHRHRVDYADLYFQYTRSESWSREGGIVKRGHLSLSQGGRVRARTGDKTASTYSSPPSTRDVYEASP